MQRRSCEQIALLLSKYADGEATPSETEQLDAHLDVCEGCKRKLAEYRQMAALLSPPGRAPEPSIRVALFREIERQKEETRRREREQHGSRSWQAHLPVRARSSLWARAWSTASPFVAASAAVLTILCLALLFSKDQPPVKPTIVAENPNDLPVVPTVPAPVDDSALVSAPAAVSTKIGALMSPSVPAGATVFATALAEAISEGIFPLSQATPVLEEGKASDLANWHTLRDPAYGYTVSYPPNWWTHVVGQSRVFTPWLSGAGDSGVPYWLDMRVEPNTGGLTAENANARLFDGKATVIRNKQGVAAWVRNIHVEGTLRYDEAYSFDSKNIYVLRLSVPRVSVDSHWLDAEALLSRMSGTFMPGSRIPAQGDMGYAPILFLNGTDLFVVQPDGQSRALTHGYGVRQFALSPDMRSVAFTSARNPNDTWASSLFLVRLDAAVTDPPASLWTGAAEIHDVAWYSDRVLLAIGRTVQQGSGVFRVPVLTGRSPLAEAIEPALIASLDDSLAGARGLAVSPDRQLVTFLAPLGEHAGTDIYALRPDGSDLSPMLSHADMVSPSDNNGPVFTADSQAIKSYTWVGGHLEAGGYRFHILLTCGNAASPTFFRGGFLYSAPGATRWTLLNQASLGVADANRMQIVHLAYSGGRLAMTGYYNDRDGRADLLAGLWLVDVDPDGSLRNLRSLPVPQSPNGIADLQWSPDGKSLIYRETVPATSDSLSSRYDSGSQAQFSIIRLDPTTGAKSTLYSTGR